LASRICAPMRKLHCNMDVHDCIHMLLSCSLFFLSGLGCRLYCSWCRSDSSGKSAQASVAVAVTVTSPRCVLSPPPPPIRLIYIVILRIVVGWDSIVGIATRYGLDGPGIESRWGRDFTQPSRPALGPTQPPVQ
jgi:hypothetical protein